MGLTWESARQWSRLRAVPCSEAYPHGSGNLCGRSHATPGLADPGEHRFPRASPRLCNNMGVLYARFGKRLDTARLGLSKPSSSRSYAPAYVNLGNIEYPGRRLPRRPRLVPAGRSDDAEQRGCSSLSRPGSPRDRRTTSSPAATIRDCAGRRTQGLPISLATLGPKAPPPGGHLVQQRRRGPLCGERRTE